MNNSFIEVFENLIEDIDDPISLLANTSSYIYDQIKDLNWVGFYIYKNNALFLGPFQGKPATSMIPLSRGVCGEAARLKKIINVPNVDLKENHISCDSNTKSEIVFPLFINQNFYAVLDIDSPVIDRFNDSIIEKFSHIIKLIENRLTSTNF